MVYKYLFDLDNTLFYTNALNNESYNHALEHYGLKPILSCDRITRSIVLSKYPTLTLEKQNGIILLKQNYFLENLNKILINQKVFRALKKLSIEDVILWTSADKSRVIKTLEFFHIKNQFKTIFFSKKDNVEKDVLICCQIFGCTKDQLFIYEDNQEIIKNLKKLGIKVCSIL